MKRIIFFFSVLCVLFGSCKKSSPVPDTRVWHEVVQEKIIDYQILRSWVPGKTGTGLEILVSPNSTKEEVLALAKSLVQQYRSTGFIVAMIFDSEEAWANRDNDKYSEEKFFKHKLVHIWVPALSDGKEITWTGEKRDEPKAKK